MSFKQQEVRQNRRVALAEALHLLGVGSDTWYSWRRDGRLKIPYFKEGAKVFLRLSDINDVIEDRTTATYTYEEVTARLGQLNQRNKKRNTK